MMLKTELQSVPIYVYIYIFILYCIQELALVDKKDELLSAQTQLRRQMGALLEVRLLYDMLLIVNLNIEK